MSSTTEIINSLRKISHQDFMLKLIVCIIGANVIYSVINKTNFKRAVTITFLILLLFYVISLDLNFAQKIEKEKNHNILRINSQRLKDNPYKELRRYVSDTVYYNNSWRMSMAAASIITLLVMSISSENTLIPLFPHFFIILFCIIYHVYSWKIHHSYFFIFKSLEDVLRHLNDNPNEKYEQICHI